MQRTQITLCYGTCPQVIQARIPREASSLGTLCVTLRREMSVPRFVSVPEPQAR